MAPIDGAGGKTFTSPTLPKRVSVGDRRWPGCAAVDMSSFWCHGLGLVRRLALLYGGRPGTLGLIKGSCAKAVSHIGLDGRPWAAKRQGVDSAGDRATHCRAKAFRPD